MSHNYFHKSIFKYTPFLLQEQFRDIFIQMNVLLITGGNSSERKISLISSQSVNKALLENGHKVELYDLRKGYTPLMEISKDHDVLFPILHGEEGEGGKLHKYLNKINKPIVGTRNFKGLRKAWYKISFKKYCDKRNVPTSPWKVVKNKSEVERFGFPSVLKDSSGGSSREVIILKSKSDLNKAGVIKILGSGRAFIEKYISGTEITVGIFDNKALPVLEIKPEKNSWFNYKSKYDGTTQEIPFAPSVDKKTQIAAQITALKIHNDFNLGTYSRSDFIVFKDTIFALEVNIIPGLTSESLIPKAAKAAGISFNEFLETLLRKSQ
jgi:D-alanine-D-alanine ligase